MRRHLVRVSALLVIAGCGQAPARPAALDEQPRPPACGALPAPPATSRYALRFDQVGYATGTLPWAIVLGDDAPPPRYRVVDATSGCVVGEGVAGPRTLTATSRAGTPLTGDRVELAAMMTAGEYLVVLEDGSRFGPIHVSAAPYAAAVPALLGFLRGQRCGPVTTDHGACHLFTSVTDGVAATHSGDGVAVDDGYQGEVTTSTGPAVDAQGGWHDAGDHIKFLGTTTFLLAVDLLALRDHEAAMTRSIGAATVADLRVELRWGLDWVIKMLGGPELYHQVSGERDHWEFHRPEDDTATPSPGYEQRPVFRFRAGQGGNLLGRAAAALAVGAEVFSEDPAYAARLKALSQRVLAEGKRRLKPQNPNPPHFYHEESVRDDLALGAAAIARASGDPRDRDEALALARSLAPEPGAPLAWGSVDALALLEVARLFPDGSPERAELAARLAALAAPIAAMATQPHGPAAAFGYALSELGNGTIAQSLGAATTCLAARQLRGPDHDARCLAVARDQLHWLFGQNPFGLSFQVGMGERWPSHVHHNLAARLPLTGAIVGGPTGWDERPDELAPVAADDPYARWSTDELFYEDNQADWVINEPALDFTAPLLYVVAELLEVDRGR